MSVRGLGIRFKTAQGVWQATRKIDFDIAPGERVGIVGESGCGKTITGLSILRLLPNNLAGLDGSIMFGDDRSRLLQHAGDARDPRQAHRHDLPGADERARSGVHGRPPDRRDAAHPHRHRQGRGAAKTIEMLRRVGIASPERRIDDYPHQLSGGMRQRVMIAAALICGPQLLIADEPTTALDVTVQAQILELLRDLSVTSKTALMLITHDLGVVAETCTRMITMYAGEVIEDAPVDAALIRPLHPYTSGLLRSLPHLSPRRGKLPSIPGRVPSITEHAERLPLQGALPATRPTAARPSRSCWTQATAARSAAGASRSWSCRAPCSTARRRPRSKWRRGHDADRAARRR